MIGPAAAMIGFSHVGARSAVSLVFVCLVCVRCVCVVAHCLGLNPLPAFGNSPSPLLVSSVIALSILAASRRNVKSPVIEGGVGAG